MTNRQASKQHGLVGNKRPSSKLRKRTNKEKAKVRSTALKATLKQIKG